MIAYVFKNIKYKSPVVVGSLIITFLVLIKLEQTSEMEALRIVFGGYPLYRPMRIMAFILAMSLVEFIHADVLVVFLKRDAYIRIRYKHHRQMLQEQFKYMLLLNVMYIFVLLFAFLVAVQIADQGLEQINWTEMVEISLRGYIECNFITIFQSVFLLKYSEQKSFAYIKTVIAVLVLLSQWNLEIISISPFYVYGWKLITNVILSVLYLVGVILIYRKNFYKRENYDNKSRRVKQII